ADSAPPLHPHDPPQVAYDAETQQLLAVMTDPDGRASTWTWKSGIWTEVEGVAATPACSSLAYDSSSEQTVCLAFARQANTTWVWSDENHWQEVNGAHEPNAGFGVLAFDGATSQLVLLQSLDG